MINRVNRNMNDQDDLYDINKYRKKKKYKQLTKKILIILCIAIVVLLVFFTIEGIKQKVDSHKSEVTTYPINLKGESPVDLEVVDGHVAVLGKSKNIFYTQSAKKSGEIVHRNVNPIVKVSGNRILTYETNGYKVRVDYKDREVGEIELENKILFAEINEDGYVAIVTFEDRFNGALIVYDPSLNQIYKYSENKKYITSFSFVGNKKGILTMQTTQDGKLSSVVRLLDFKKEKDTVILEKQFNGETVYKTNYKNEKIYTFTNRAVVILNNKGKEINRYELEGDLQHIDYINGKSILFVEDVMEFNKVNIIMLDDENEVISNASFSGKIEDVYISDNRIVVLTDENILKYNYELEELEKYENNKGYSEVAIIGEQVYAMNADYLYKVEKEKVE